MTRNNNIGRRILFFLVISMSFIALIQQVNSSGSIQTSLLSPITADVCGSYPNNITITAMDILNLENVVLTNVNAMLILPSDSSLSFVSSQTVSLGNIPAMGSSSINPSWIIRCNFNNSNSYDIYVDYLSSNGYSASSEDEALSTIIVHGLSIDMNISVGGTDNSQNQQEIAVISDTTPTINITTGIDSICKGSLDADKSYSNMDLLFNGAGKFHIYAFASALTDGYHSVYIKCNSSSGISANSTKTEFVIDTIPPVLVLASPNGLVTQTYTTFSINTNENSECKYSMATQEYTNMNLFERTGSLIHSKAFDNLATGPKTYYVKCKDKAGNIAFSSFIIEVDQPVKAKIKSSDESPVREGTINVELTTTKNLRETPLLNYYFNDKPSEVINIPLSGSNNKWSGYMLLDAGIGNKIGTFIFSGYDLNGNQGTEITEGKVFLIDTIKPVSPSTVQIINNEGNIRLEWYYEGEKQDYFNIYKSTKSGVNYIDYYESTNASLFIDKSVNSGTTYYYRVAAVDEAGNIGSLSQEVTLTAYKDSSSSSSGSQQNVERTDIPTYETLKELNRTIRDIDKILIDIESAQSNLENNKNENELIAELGLLDKVSEAKNDADSLRNQLVALRNFDSLNSEINSAVQEANNKLKRIRTETPKDVKLSEQISGIQPVFESIETEAEEILVNFNLDANQKNNYLKKQEKIKQNLKVSYEVRKISITYIDSQSIVKVIVVKEVSYESPDLLENLILIENIPKAAVENAYEIEFKTSDYLVLKEDPIIRWNLAQLNYDKTQIKYIINKDFNLENIKASRTVVVQDPSQYEQITQNSITGFSVSGLWSNVAEKTGDMQILPIILGIIIITGLLFYYFVFVKQEGSGKLQKSNNNFNPNSNNGEKTSLLSSFSNKLQNNLSRDNFDKNKSQFQLNKSEIKNNEIRNKEVKGNEIKNNEITPDRYFYMKNGYVLKSIEDLSEALKIIDDSEFHNHVTNDRNDFADWINTVFSDKELANQFYKISSKDSAIMLLESNASYNKLNQKNKLG
jgi:hypothetical protein